MLAYPDKSLEVNGAILEGGGGGDVGERLSARKLGDSGANGASLSGARLGALGPTRTHVPQYTQSPRLRFRALLTEGGDRSVQLHGG